MKYHVWPVGIALATLLPYATAAAQLPPFPEPPQSIWSFESQLAAVAQAQSSSTPSIPSLTSLDREDRTSLIALTRPTIVRILTEAVGTSTVPAFTLDLNTFTWKFAPEAKPLELYVEDYLSGSGFIVNSNGYIVTNAHVATDVYLRDSLAEYFAYNAFYDAYYDDDLSEAIIKKLNEDYKKDPDAYYERNANARKAGAEFIKPYLQVPPFNIVVLKPSVTVATTTSAQILKEQLYSYTQAKKELEKTIDEGVPAQLVYENREYLNDERDVAVIKVDYTNLPSLRISVSDVVATGDVSYLFGYPANADYGLIDFEPSFTQGTINALKDSIQKTFKYLQTDAKSSGGSSGGPLFNPKGEAIGILTLGSGGSLFSGGDSFAFAVPISIAREALDEAGVSYNNEDDYPSFIHNGLRLLDEKRCKAALDYFDRAANMEAVFGTTTSFIEPYIDECVALIASGESIDSFWDELSTWVGDKGMIFWGLSGGAVVLIAGLGAGIFLLMKRLRKEEKLLEKLEHEIEHTPAATPAPAAQNPMVTITPTTPPPTVVAPQLKTYIADARKSGQNDEQIKTALMGSGWKAEDIAAALR